jgi:hypothetical protein
MIFRDQADEDVVTTITQNLSSQGFYCLSKERFAVGERLLCILHIPSSDLGGGGHLECRVEVVRIEENAADGQYGVACRTEDYRFTAGELDFPAERIP